jgi:hypothetical protein
VIEECGAFDRRYSWAYDCGVSLRSDVSIPWSSTTFSAGKLRIRRLEVRLPPSALPGEILRAEADLEEAGVVLADAFLQTDAPEWLRLRDKRAAAFAGVSPVRRRKGRNGPSVR